ncbi:MAG: T9SS type A sorting domain-containing protein [Bacteroidota bacterium]
MKKNLLFSYTLIAALALSSHSYGQPDKFVYAVTDLDQSGSGWNALRKFNLKTGEYSEVLLNGLNAKYPAYDAATKSEIQTSIVDSKLGNYLQTPFNTGVAAIAYDSRNNRLYFTPMFIDQLRYIDLKTMKLYYVTNQSFTTLGSMHNDEAKTVIRMVITPDGNGYAITNDGNAFIRFNTSGRTTKIDPPTSLVDAPTNQSVSIHNRCGGFGGDMIADDNGNLYIISAQNHVFKITAGTKVATHLGVITGLPGDFTTNGVAVDDKNQLLLSSAVNSKSMYVVNPANWKASPIITLMGVYKSSDLANSNVLKTGNNILLDEIKTIGQLDDVAPGKVQVYPNPVTENVFTIHFNELSAGDYSLELTDIMGRLVMKKKIGIGNEQQTEKVNINPGSARGIYLVKLRDKDSKEVFTQKVVVQ